MNSFFKSSTENSTSSINESTPTLTSKLYSSFSLAATARSAVSAASSAASVASTAASVAASSAVSVASSVASSASVSSHNINNSSHGASTGTSQASKPSSSLTSLPLQSNRGAASNVGGVLIKKEKDEIVENDLYVEYLKELRLNYEYAGDKVAIFDRFYNLLEPGVLYLSLEVFVIDSKKRGHSVQWADAAFRAVDIEKRGSLNKFEYLFAVLSLQTDERFLKNPRWLELRRNLVFTYYDRGEKGELIPITIVIVSTS